jgi:hypothetical protein
MIDPISSAKQADAASATESATQTQKTLQAKTQSSGSPSSGIEDTVTINSAAQAAAGTQTQASGDQQAKQLVAEQQVAKNTTQDATNAQ